MNLDTILVDVLDYITRPLGREDLLNLVCVCRSIHDKLRPLLYRNIDFYWMHTEDRDVVAGSVARSEDLASAVRSIRIATLHNPDAHPVAKITVDTNTSALLRACRFVRRMELVNSSLGGYRATIESCAAHLQLDHLGISSSVDAQIKVYIPLLSQQASLVQLTIDPNIYECTDDALPVHLPCLRSISGCVSMVRLFRRARAIENVNLIISQPKHREA